MDGCLIIFIHTQKNDHFCYWAGNVKDEAVVASWLSRWHPRSPTCWYSHPSVIPTSHIVPCWVCAEETVCHFQDQVIKYTATSILVIHLPILCLSNHSLLRKTVVTPQIAIWRAQVVGIWGFCPKAWEEPRILANSHVSLKSSPPILWKLQMRNLQATAASSVSLCAIS